MTQNSAEKVEEQRRSGGQPSTTVTIGTAILVFFVSQIIVEWFAAGNRFKAERREVVSRMLTEAGTVAATLYPLGVTTSDAKDDLKEIEKLAQQAITKFEREYWAAYPLISDEALDVSVARLRRKLRDIYTGFGGFDPGDELRLAIQDVGDVLRRLDRQYVW